jgi:hypothetical protein
MEAKIKSINSVKLITSGEAMDAILRTTDSAEVRAELQRWLDSGARIKDSKLPFFSTEELVLFTDKLPDLILALYVRQQEEKKGADR